MKSGNFDFALKIFQFKEKFVEYERLHQGWLSTIFGFEWDRWYLFAFKDYNDWEWEMFQYSKWILFGLCPILYVFFYTISSGHQIFMIFISLAISSCLLTIPGRFQSNY